MILKNIERRGLMILFQEVIAPGKKLFTCLNELHLIS